jgi:P2-related tail formation protein
MRHSVYLKLKTQFVYTLLTLTTHSRSESNTDFTFKHDISGLECIINESTYTWLDKLIKETSNFASKTHHPPSTGHFSRHDAQVVQMITTAIIAYAGKCISDNAAIK